MQRHHLQKKQEAQKLHKLFVELRDSLPLGHVWLHEEGVEKQLRWLFMQAMQNHDYELKIELMETYDVSSNAYDETRETYKEQCLKGESLSFEEMLQRTHLLMKVGPTWFTKTSKSMLLAEEDFPMPFFCNLYPYGRTMTQQNCRDLLLSHMARKSSDKHDAGCFQRDDDVATVLGKSKAYYCAALGVKDAVAELSLLQDRFKTIWGKSSELMRGKKKDIVNTK